MGTWIEFESEHKERVRRISAQKSLAMPSSATSIAVDRALTDLLYGYAELNATDVYSMIQWKRTYRWGQQPNISPVSDFDKLLTYLFSDTNETNARYVEEVRRDNERRIETPETKLTATKRVWEGVLPHRKLEIGGGKVETRVVSDESETNDSLYNASEMSDGERVVFYLVGQALSAPEDGVIVVDEPELHLHRSIQARL